MKKTTFFSNEDLDNILRRMEGLTTDEKEAYLDARLKELESLPDSRKKELQEAARTGMKRTLELAYRAGFRMNQPWRQATKRIMF